MRAVRPTPEPYHLCPMNAPDQRHENTSAHDAAAPPRVCIVVSRYNTTVTGNLRSAAISAYESRFGGDAGAFLGIVEAPGAFELTAIATAAVECGAYDGVVTLGCVIRGETDHDRYISQAVASGLTSLTVQTGIPVAFGVITANTPAQALARAGGPDGAGPGNKGTEAMDALLDAIDAMRHVYDSADRGRPASFETSRSSTDKAAAIAGRSM